ncbi:MAG: SEL1-like repeat protein [Sulfuritalea sp.]|nr:SEL1-like repeat protein [Sulfuritalea sp.]
MKVLWQHIACCAVLLGIGAVPAAASGSATGVLTYEQSEDRANFIAQVRKARQGDAEAQWQVGMTYAGLGDYARAVPMLLSSASAGHARAANLLGWLHEDGRGTEKSIEQARHWYRIAADQGEADAMSALGRLLLQGKQPEAHEAARQLFERSARLGDADGQYFLGWMLAAPIGGQRDDATAFGWFIKAANQGHVGGQLAAATHLLAGRGVSMDKKAAGDWLIRAAETQDPVAHYLLGQLRLGAEEADLERVHSSFRVAAVAGHREAQFALATLLAKSPVDADKKEAAGWFAKAHEAGHIAAANRLGELYRDGAGVPLQLDKARSIFQQAAEQSDADAMYNLAEMQNDGHGGERDTGKALEWYTRAAMRGHKRAVGVVDSLLSSSVKLSDLGLKGFWQ